MDLRTGFKNTPRLNLVFVNKHCNALFSVVNTSKLDFIVVSTPRIYLVVVNTAILFSNFI